MKQHPTVVIHEATRFGEDIVVGAVAVIEDGVETPEGMHFPEFPVAESIKGVMRPRNGNQ
jgi:acyl-[acyl carrier protein]--UDP-N-acetylglucosamine O-acyltransferase